MTRAVGDDEQMMKSLQEVVSLFKEAQNSVFKLMSSVRAPNSRSPLFPPLTHSPGLGAQVSEGTEILGHALPAQFRSCARPPWGAFTDSAREIEEQSRAGCQGVNGIFDQYSLTLASTLRSPASGSGR